MTSSYPAGLDSFDEPSAPTTTALGSAGDTSPARKHSEHHRDLGDAIEAVQAELGLDPAGSFSTVASRISKHGVHVHNTTNITLTNGSETNITFNTEREDTDGYHSTASNTHLFTVPAGLGGRYAFGFYFRFSGNVNGGDYIVVYKNTALIAVQQMYGGVLHGIQGQATLDVGDTLYCMVNQSASRTTLATSGIQQNNTEGYMYLIGA